MTQKQRILSIAIVALTLLVIFSGQSFSTISSSHTIQLTAGESLIYVNEKIDIEPQDMESNITELFFWIPTDADDVQASVNNTIIPLTLSDDTVYQANLSGIQQSSLISKSIDLTYTIPISLQQFSKTVLRNTSQLTISYDGDEIGSATNLAMDSSLSVSFPVESDAALFNVYTLTLTILLIILLLVSFVYGLRKKKNGKTRKRAFESQEMLSTEKTLLMDVLKNIEKLHRSEKLSDDTYHKLKGYYKQQTVEIMSQMEDTDSKIKK